MKRFFLLAAQALCCSAIPVPSLAAATPAIERIRRDPAFTLAGVILPAGADLFMLSGFPASAPAAGSAIEWGNTKAQTLSALGRIQDELVKKGFTMNDVVKMVVYVVADPALGKADLAGMNEAYRTYFGTGRNPNWTARSVVEVKALGRPDYLVEVEATAARIP